MPNSIDMTNPPDNLAELIELAMPELENFDHSLQVRRIISRARVLQLNEVLLTSWTERIHLIDEELSADRAKQRKDALNRLESRAWVYYGTDIRAEEIRSNKARKERLKLAKTVAEHDHFLLGWAWPLLGSDPENAVTLRDISRGTGRRDDAEDVIRLVDLYRDHWSEIKDMQKAVTEARLNQAQADATKQLDYLRNGAGNPARKLADAAYSLWYVDYTDLMRLGRYLTWNDPESIQRFPGVKEAGNTSSKAGSNKADQKDNEPADEADELDTDSKEQDDDANA